MGLCASTDRRVEGKYHARETFSASRSGDTHVLAVAFDYAGSDGALTCTKDSNRFVELARTCGAANVTYLNDSKVVPGDGFPSRQRFYDEFHRYSSTVPAGDTFIFFFAGHGDQQKDCDGDEEDGMDSSLSFVNENGEEDPIIDDELSELLQLFDEDVRILVITDCCHAGTVCDLENWGARAVVHLGACRDSQSASDTGDGGSFTTSLVEAIEAMCADGETNPSVVDVYNSAKDIFGEVFADLEEPENNQEFTLSWTDALDEHGPESFAWPFYPGPNSGYNVATHVDEHEDEDDSG